MALCYPGSSLSFSCFDEQSCSHCAWQSTEIATECLFDVLLVLRRAPCRTQHNSVQPFCALYVNIVFHHPTMPSTLYISIGISHWKNPYWSTTYSHEQMFSSIVMLHILLQTLGPISLLSARTDNIFAKTNTFNCCWSSSLFSGEAGQEYPLPHQQRGPGQESDYRPGGAHQWNGGKRFNPNNQQGKEWIFLCPLQLFLFLASSTLGWHQAGGIPCQTLSPP